MIWQDAVITIANVVFSVSLIPQVYSGFKTKTGHIKFQTSIPTFISLYVMSYAVWTLDLYFSAIVTAITGTMWMTLCIQRVKYRN